MLHQIDGESFLINAHDRIRTRDDGGNDNSANAANAEGPKPVNPNQLQTLLHFDGNQGEALVNWIECLETVRLTYNWSIDLLVQVAKAKGGSTVAEWDRKNGPRGIIVNKWEGDDGFRARLFKKFDPKYTLATAVNAVSNLKQKPRESCG